MLFHVPVKGYFEVNAYIYANDITRHGFLIDPGAEPQRFLDIIAKKSLSIDQILLTHGHFDHMGAAEALQKALGIPLRMSQKGRAYAEDSFLNLSAHCGPSITLQDVDYFSASEETVLSTDGCQLVAVPVPGHTPDSVMYYAPDDALAFVGDTIFKGSIGTTQFPGGDIRQLMTSIVEKILPLPDETVLYSGHSDPTTVGREKQGLVRSFY